MKKAMLLLLRIPKAPGQSMDDRRRWRIVWCEGQQPVMGEDGQPIDGGGIKSQQEAQRTFAWWSGVLYADTRKKCCGPHYPNKAEQEAGK